MVEQPTIRRDRATTSLVVKWLRVKNITIALRSRLPIYRLLCTNREYCLELDPKLRLHSEWVPVTTPISTKLSRLTP